MNKAALCTYVDRNASVPGLDTQTHGRGLMAFDGTIRGSPEWREAQTYSVRTRGVTASSRSAVLSLRARTFVMRARGRRGSDSSEPRGSRTRHVLVKHRDKPGTHQAAAQTPAEAESSPQRRGRCTVDT